MCWFRTIPGFKWLPMKRGTATLAPHTSALVAIEEEEGAAVSLAPARVVLVPCRALAGGAGNKQLLGEVQPLPCKQASDMAAKQAHGSAQSVGWQEWLTSGRLRLFLRLLLLLLLRLALARNLPILHAAHGGGGKGADLCRTLAALGSLLLLLLGSKAALIGSCRDRCLSRRLLGTGCLGRCCLVLGLLGCNRGCGGGSLLLSLVL